MKAEAISKLDQRIADEFYRAAVHLGADPAAIRQMPLSEMYDALEALGADRLLLVLAGSWGDGVAWTEDDDAATLELLRQWMANADREVATPH